VQLVWGGFSVSNATLNRFFSLHYLLPFVLAALAMVHLLAKDQAGSGNPLGISANADRLAFHPHFTFKDLVTVLLYLAALAAFVFYAPNALGHPDNYTEANPLSTPASIVPEWYLLPFYAVLRSIPSKLLGVVAMFASLLILLVLPLADTSRVRGAQFRPLYRAAFWVLVADFAVLMVIGARHPEDPYLVVGQVATALYFAWFLVVVPALGVLENTLLELALNPRG
jgi:ubiquinol-cytochrome c reductase cytochrome b subunit